MNTNRDTRTLILDIAQDLIQRQSYSGISFQNLAKAIGIKKGSMYYHFESKEDLVVELLQRAATELQEWFQQGEGLPAPERLERYFAVYQNRMEPGKKLCPAGAFVGEWDNLTPAIQNRINRVFEVQIKGVEVILDAGIDAGDFARNEESVQSLAHWVVSNLQGALMTSRATGSDQPFQRSLRIIRRFLTEG
jgi:TetR/AcrR family transcriptional repressor of nem operon